MLKNIFKHFYHLFLYSFAFVILTAAIFITVIRLALPEIGGYRQQTQDWISQYMNYPVEISNIDANWDSWTPNLHLHNVSILDPVSNEQILNFKSVLISIDIFESLYRNEVIPESITVSDLSLTLIRRQDGSVTASRYLPDEFKDEQTNNDALAKWFLAQKNILIRKAQITLLDLNQNDEPLLLSDATLRMRNNDYRTQIEGSAILPASYGNVVNFALDASGDVLTADWSGEIYLEGKNINISPLLAEIKDLDIENYEGTGDVKLWSTWNQAKLRRLEGQVTLKDLKLADNQSKIYINKLSGNFSATRRTDKGIELTFNVKELITPNGSWPETIMSLKKIYVAEHDEYRYIANASYLDLDDVSSFLHIFTNLSKEFTPLNDFEFTGNILNSVIKYDPMLDNSEKIYIEAEFSQLNAKFSDPSIELEGLNGHIQGTQKQGSIHIASNVIKIKPGDFLTKPLVFYELNTDLSWQTQDKNLFISTRLLDAHTQDFDLQLKGKLNFIHGRELPFIDILLELSNGELDKVAGYLPTSTPEKITRWLDNSLVTGKIPSAEFVFRGWLEDYPFKNNEGIFQGSAEVSQGTLNYHKAWPPIEGIDATLIINGDTLTVNANSGNFYGAEISKVSAIIENLASRGIKKSVIINGHIDGAIKDGLLFIKNSPLQTNQSLKGLPSQIITGDLGLDLILDVPLPPGLILVDGTISLRDAYINSDIGIELTDLNGTIDFTHSSVSAEGIKARYFDHPVELAMASSHGSPIKSVLSGKADNQFISAQLLRHFPSLEPLKDDIEKRITGSCLWEASIVNSDSNDNLNTGKKLVITSSLEGLSLDLPTPFAKSYANKPLELTINFPDKNRQEINIQYANILNGIIDVNEINNEKFVTTSLSFGGEAIHKSKNNQISITGYIDRLIVNEWLDLIPDNTSEEKSVKNDKPVHLDIQVGSIEFINQNFSHVNLKLDNTDSDYHLNINAEDISGDIHFNRLSDENPVNVILQKLTLAKNETKDPAKEEKHKIIPDSIPPLNIKISELIYNNIELGEMNLVTSRIDNGLSVDKINFKKTDMTISGAGIWNRIGDEHYSKFNLSLNAASMKAMLETFNYDVAAIEEGEINLSLDAQWQGTPVDFSLNNLDGTLDMEIGKGRFTDINPSAGRLFGLLSLQTLPRRLSLDFSDLFGKGLAFDNIEGHFIIENGNAYTNNLAMTGPSVNINISGRTGLIQQDYDQIATITPKITDSLPIASALFGPIGIGVGAVIFLASEIFNSLPEKIDTLLRKQYTITGAWDNPEITKIIQKEDELDNG